MYLSKSMIFVFAIAQNMDMVYDDIMHRKREYNVPAKIGL
jgi:hypothetical protein